jgi:16S rRNA (guanine966-N2)-methyltransferase
MSGLRITAGSLRGRKVVLPGSGIRPTSSRAREAVFNILSAQIVGARFLDLFSGSGIMALEAISRGASKAVAVDASDRTVRELNDLATRWQIPLEARWSDAILFVESSSSGEPWDIVYADPPYDSANYPKLLRAIDTHLPLSEVAIVAVEHRRDSPPLLEPFERLEQWSARSWGEVAVLFYVKGTGREMK